MSNNLHRNVSLGELAESAKMSASHLGHMFKSETGMAPGQYLMALRMERARDLLIGSELSVKEIMFEVGFSDKSNFVRSFKKASGLSPSEVRAKRLNPRPRGKNRKID